MSQVGDTRPDIVTLDDMQFCYISAGPFWMGSNKAEDKNVRNDEPPRHKVNIPYNYWLARYPVTVGQYQIFVKESDHKPKWRGSVEGIANHLVKDVTWYEAKAFCVWLTKKWREDGKLPLDWEVRLAKEAEWEKGARGGLEIPEKAVIKPVAILDFEEKVKLKSNPYPWRMYPWGSDETQEKMNVEGTGIDGTSTVGIFPLGRSVYDCEELSGNVWEWTLSKYKNYPYQEDDRNELQGSDRRVVRGGSYYICTNKSRLLVRYNVHPHRYYNIYGFRVAIAPILKPKKQ